MFVTLLVKSEDPTDRFRSWLTSSGVASRSIALSEEKPSGLLACAARGPARLSIVRPVRKPGIRSFAALLGMTAPASRYAYPQSEDWFEPRRAGGKIISSGASSRLAFGLLPKKRPNCLSGGDRTFRPFLPREAGTSVPITKQLCASPRVAPSEIVGCKRVDNGDTAHNLRNLLDALVGCRFVPVALPAVSARIPDFSS